MKKLKYTVLLALGIGLLVSCSATSHVVDDDVYVSKNPQMTSTEEVNDVSSYENYRYHKDRGDAETRYRDDRLFGTSIFIIGGLNNPMYSPYYDPFRYGYSAYSPFYDPFSPWNNSFYPNSWGYGMGYGYYPMSFYYDSYYSPWGYSPYGYGYNPYCNNYNNNYYNQPAGNISSNYNTHYGPRHSMSGVNNNRRGHAPESKGMVISQPNTGNRNVKQTSANTQAGQNTRSKEVSSAASSERTVNNANTRSTEVKSSRSVSTGTGLSRNGSNVSTRSTTQRGGGSFDSNSGSRGSIDVRQNTDSKPTRTFESGNSGTTRNSGGTTTSPRSNGSSGGSGGTTVNRRGGN